MNPPATIRVLHLDFELRFVDENIAMQAEAFGWCSKHEQIIFINRKLKPRLLADVAIHELLHAIHFAVGAEEEMVEEQVAQHFSGPLCCVIRDNPRFFDWVRWLLAPAACIPDDDDGAYQ